MKPVLVSVRLWWLGVKLRLWNRLEQNLLNSTKLLSDEDLEEVSPVFVGSRRQKEREREKGRSMRDMVRELVERTLGTEAGDAEPESPGAFVGLDSPEGLSMSTETLLTLLVRTHAEMADIWKALGVLEERAPVYARAAMRRVSKATEAREEAKEEAKHYRQELYRANQALRRKKRQNKNLQAKNRELYRLLGAPVKEEDVA